MDDLTRLLDAGSLPGDEECCLAAYGAVLADEEQQEALEERRAWLGRWHPDRFDLARTATRLKAT